MSDEEVAEILYYGEEPDAMTVWGWEVRKAVREEVLERRFREAYGAQKK